MQNPLLFWVCTHQLTHKHSMLFINRSVSMFHVCDTRMRSSYIWFMIRRSNKSLQRGDCSLFCSASYDTILTRLECSRPDQTRFQSVTIFYTFAQTFFVFWWVFFPFLRHIFFRFSHFSSAQFFHFSLFFSANFFSSFRFFINFFFLWP